MPPPPAPAMALQRRQGSKIANAKYQSVSISPYETRHRSEAEIFEENHILLCIGLAAAGAQVTETYIDFFTSTIRYYLG
jgi:hypothetical protein